MIIAEGDHDSSVSDNVRCLQNDCNTMLSELEASLYRMQSRVSRKVRVTWETDVETIGSSFTTSGKQVGVGLVLETSEGEAVLNWGFDVCVLSWELCIHKV
jgi:hypothetical protein